MIITYPFVLISCDTRIDFESLKLSWMLLFGQQFAMTAANDATASVIKRTCFRMVEIGTIDGYFPFRAKDKPHSLTDKFKASSQGGWLPLQAGRSAVQEAGKSRTASTFRLSPFLCSQDCHGFYSRYCEAMTKATKLLHTRYRVNDLERTLRFYKDVLGLEEVRRQKSPRGSELVFLKTPGSEELIEICCFPASGPVEVQPDLTHLAFEVESLKDFGEHLAKMGIKYSDGPHLRPDGGGIAFIDAPEGYEIELIQPSKTGPGY